MIGTREPTGARSRESAAARTVGRLLRECGAILPADGSSAADAREIVSCALNAPRFWPDAHESERVSEAAWSLAVQSARARAAGMPLQYAIGRAAFRHLTLEVDRKVLIPRPETEVLVDIVLARVHGGLVADVGTGSGAIALALATEGTFAKIIATDISKAALGVARRNAKGLLAGTRCALEFRAGSLLAPLAGEELDVLVSNPPYIAAGEMRDLPPEVRDWEPHLALAGGVDGLDTIRELIAGAPDVLKPGALLALETDSRRAGRSADIINADGRYADVEVLPDLTQRLRFVIARRR